MDRDKLRFEIRNAVIDGIRRNGERIFDKSQQTEECFVPVRTGMLKHSGYVTYVPQGVEVGYTAPYSCIPYLKDQSVLMGNGSIVRANKLRPGDIVNSGYNDLVEVVAIKKQPDSDYKLLKITTESGKEIIVTDNHLVSTTQGFVRADNLFEGLEINVSDNWTDYSLIECLECGNKFKALSITHLKKHGLTQQQYKDRYNIKTLRVEKRKQKNAWNKGLTKDSDYRIAEYSLKLVNSTSFKTDRCKQKMRENHWSTKREHSFNYKIENHSNKCRECNEWSDDKVFCSLKCEIQWRKIRYSGERNPRFGTLCKAVGTSKGGYREDLGHYVRSSWEANIARLIKFIGMSYYYESDRFDLYDGRTYCPDFLVPSLNGYVEVKGYEGDNKFATAVGLYSQYNFYKIDRQVYKELEEAFCDKVPNWEQKK